MRYNIPHRIQPLKLICNIATATLVAVTLSLCCFAEENKMRTLDGMTLLELINYTSERLDETMVISPRVRVNRKVTIYSPNKVNNEELRNIFNSVLEMHGYGAVEVGGITKIVRDRKMRSMPLPVVGG